MRNTFLVCYDISDDKRLRAVFRTMRDFGDSPEQMLRDLDGTE